MFEGFTATIKKYELVKKGDGVILGVSGGPDSMFMLHHFLALKNEYKLTLVCAHFNHALRDEADEEERFVKKACAALGVDCISQKKDVKAVFRGDSLEQTARLLRYDFFEQCFRQTKIRKLALAHHKDDLAETVLLRIMRGAGLRGLRAFLPKTQYKRLLIIRPLIALRKEEILAWLAQQGIGYCVDESNFQDVYLRNRVRRELVPLLESMNPNIVETLANLASSVSLDYDFMHRHAHEVFTRLTRKGTNGSVNLDVVRLKELPPAVFNNVVRIALEETKGSARRFESRHIEEINHLVFHRPVGSIVDLPGVAVKKEEKNLIFQAS